MLLVYLSNCFWLIVPVILLNVLFTRWLPRLYQPDVFDNIPGWVAAIENALRILVFLLPLLMRMNAGGRKFGLGLYAIGLLLYALSWVMQIRFPRSAWSMSRLGFMAPAYTPALWLAGIALIGRSVFLPVPWTPWIYAGLAGGFLAFHNLHCWIAYSRAKQR